jgi:hypothetical protein
MAEVKCIACNRLNAPDDRFCATCGSSLDLKLCASCEAINNPVADTCHSCGKPLAAEAPLTPAVEEISEAPFYAPQRFEPADEAPRRSVASRLARAAKVTTLVVLPLAAIALWGWQLYGQKVLNTPYVQHLLRTPYAQKVLSYLPSARMPAAEIQTKVAPAAAVAGPLPVVEVPKTKPVVAEIKRAPKPSATPVVRVEPAPAQASAPAAVPALPVEASAGKTTAAAPRPPQAAAPRDRVTHTRPTPGAAPVVTAPLSTKSAEAPAPPPPPLTGGTASCPRAAAILGLCSPNTKEGGS